MSASYPLKAAAEQSKRMHGS